MWPSICSQTLIQVRVSHAKNFKIKINIYSLQTDAISNVSLVIVIIVVVADVGPSSRFLSNKN